MPAPIDYGALQPTPDPVGNLTQGFAQGLQIRQAQQQLQQQQVAQQRSQSFAKDVGALSTLPKPTAQDYSTVALKYPEFADKVQASWKQLSADQQKTEFADGMQTYAALDSERPDVAIARLQQSRDAKKNSGDQSGADSDDDLIKQIQTDPAKAKTHLGLAIAASAGPEQFGSVMKSLKPDQTDLQKNLSDPTSAQYIKDKDKRQEAIEQARIDESKAYHAEVGARADAKAAAGDDALLDADTVKVMAAQGLAGDKTVFQNLGRGAQGAKNIVALRTEMIRQGKEQGMSGADIAAKNAEFTGTLAAERTAGTRAANVELASSEASKIIPIAREASAAVPRSSFMPFSQLEQMVKKGTNDPAIRKFVAANNTLVNVYSRAISPNGVGTVHDKEHARQLLDTAFDNESYNAVLDTMEQEIKAAREAPAEVRAGLRDAVTGGKAQATLPANATPQQILEFYKAKAAK